MLTIARFAVDDIKKKRAHILLGSIATVLLVDDEIDSRWTMTVAAWQLGGAGSGPVLPFALRTR